MQHSWIWLTVLAALLQAVRTAAQKQLNEHISTLATTYVRALLGLPIMIGYLGLVGWPEARAITGGGLAFAIYCLIAAVTQNIGTAALLTLYRRRNFAVANQLTRTSLVFTALFGTLLFSEMIALAGWLAIALTLAGAALLTARQGGGGRGALEAVLAGLDGRSLATGLFVGAMFGLCNVTIREATLSLGSGGAIERGAVTVVTVTTLQLVTLGGWLALREPRRHLAQPGARRVRRRNECARLDRLVRGLRDDQRLLRDRRRAGGGRVHRAHLHVLLPRAADRARTRRHGRGDRRRAAVPPRGLSPATVRAAHSPAGWNVNTSVSSR